jgi:prepilin-type N-terminal cleavage/methylation domain-containing protein
MTKIRNRRQQKGFTLIEIMIVVLIIANLLAIAIPNFLHAREASRAKSCQGNLRQIETAKEQWAMDTKAASDAEPTMANLTTDYIKSEPACPSSGSYAVGNMSTSPACSIGTNGAGDYDDHQLP